MNNDFTLDPFCIDFLNLLTNIKKLNNLESGLSRFLTYRIPPPLALNNVSLKKYVYFSLNQPLKHVRRKIEFF